MEFESDSPHPGLLLKPEDATEMVRIQYRTHRTKDPELQRALARAVDDAANSPDEAEEGKRLVRQLMHATNRPMRPEDVPEILGAMRSGEDPREVLSRQASDREERRQPTMSAAEEQDEFHSQPPEVWNAEGKSRQPRFVGRAERVEEAVVSANLAPEQESVVRRIVKVLERNQGPASPSLIREIVQSVRNGRGERAILAKYGEYVG